MSELVTNYNVDPYYDDYDLTKGYYRIVFRHSIAVQARELTQLQTMLQQQISFFGNHVFKDGSIVSGVPISHQSSQKFVHVKNQFASNTTAQVTAIANTYTVVSANTGVRAVVKLTATGFESQYPNTNVLYVDYIKTGKDGSNNDVFEFTTGEQLTIYDENQGRLANLDSNNIFDTINVISSNVASGMAYAVSVGDGLIFQKGFFVYVEPQTVLVRPHDQVVDGYVVGFVTGESTIDEIDDDTLNDNANGSTNYNAPGAHRLKLTPVLTSIARADLEDETSFLPIVEFEGDVAVIERQDSVYAKLGEELSRRTDEESGNYVVKPFAVETLTNTANSDIIDYAVSPGLGYVRGSRVELIGTKKVSVERAITTANAEAQIVTANYGNYVLVNEAAGLFYFDTYGALSIYDTAQATITDAESVASAPSGNVIGTAICRGFEYESGDKGTANGQFRVYIDNIVMNSGFSFSRDARSLHSNNVTYGYAKGDLVRDSSNTVNIYDSSFNSLVFQTGLYDVKTLTDEQFIFRDVVTGTLQANGLAVFTLNSEHAGGSERLNFSPGAVGSTAELDFTFALGSAAYTSNLTGTIGFSGTTATGVGTNFTTDFVVGDYIRATTTTDVRRITAIANTTSMTLAASATAVANTFSQYWPAGYIMNLSGSNGAITVISNTQFSVNSPANTLASGTQTIYATYPVLRASAVPIAKEARKDRYVKIDCTANTTGPWDLGLVDIYKISDIYVGTTYADTNPSHPEWFSFDNGQTATQYGHGTLTVNPSYANNITASTRLLLKLSHLVANTTAGIGYFSVDSYPFIQSGDTANSTNINIGDVPRFRGYDVRELIDFRPQHNNTANSATIIADATVNPTANTTYNVSASGSYLIQPATNFQADVQTYLGRTDMLMLSDTGELSVVQGLPAENPRTPLASPDGMAIAVINVPAYPSYSTREGEAYRRSDIQTSIRLVTNRRYTMKDIGTIDQRLKTAEYYITLNALEQAAKDLTIPDANGLDRFKNGIFANPFNTHQLGAVDDFEYKISIDKDKSIARPYFKAHPIDYTFDANTSGNVTVTGPIVSLDFTSELYISQPYASKIRNVCESVWNWGGVLELYPAYDHSRDETRLPAVNVTLDLASPWEDFAASPFGSEFGTWRTQSNVQSSTSTATSSNTRNQTRTTTQTTTTTSTTTSSRDVTKLIVDTSEQAYEFGSFVKDVSMNPYIRSREVAFIAYGIKPNTAVHAFFDDVNVDEHCAPGELSGQTSVAEGHENEIIDRIAEYGTQLVSDDDGVVVGIFIIPEGEFRTGDRTFRLVNVEDLVTGNDAIITSASARYTASTLAVTSQSISLYTVEPELTVSSFTERNVARSTQVSTRSTSTSTRPQQSTTIGPSGVAEDPLAQSFLTSTPVDVTGVFIDKVGVYFKRKDPTLGITAYLMEMNNGVPDTARVLSSIHLPASNVATSNDATSETVFDFPGLPYCASDRFYAVQFKPDGDSPEYEIWCSQIGQNDVTTGSQIFSNPYVGVLFTSANRNTWTARQEEDLKFNLYRAKFVVGSANAVFQNENDEYFTIDGITLVNTAIVPMVGDLVYSQNATGNLVTSNTDPFGRIQSVDDANARIVIDTSNGLYDANTTIEIHRPYLNNVQTINANTKVGSATLLTIDNIPYSAIVPRFAQITPQHTSIEAFHRGMDESYGADSVAYGVVSETENERYDKTRIMASYSNEKALAANVKSSILTYTLSTENDYVSPLLDMTRKNGLVIENIINNDDTDEHTRQGHALSKYISPRIILADGQDAEDLRVYVTAARPSGTDVQVYVKFLNAEDADPFNDKLWTLLDVDAPSVYTSSFDPNEYREYMYTVPTAVPAVPTAYLNENNGGVIEYAAASGPEYVGFKSFAIKIVLLAANIHIIPTVNDVRAIALQI